MIDLVSLQENFKLEEGLRVDIHYTNVFNFISFILEKLKPSMEELEKSYLKWGLKMNVKKYKMIFNNEDKITYSK